MLRQIKADMLDAVEDHHRQHHDDWLTVSGTETTTTGTRWMCLCCHGHTVRVEADRVRKSREIALPPQPEPTRRSGLLSSLRRVLGQGAESGVGNSSSGPRQGRTGR